MAHAAWRCGVPKGEVAGVDARNPAAFELGRDDLAGVSALQQGEAGQHPSEPGVVRLDPRQTRSVPWTWG